MALAIKVLYDVRAESFQKGPISPQQSPVSDFAPSRAVAHAAAARDLTQKSPVSLQKSLNLRREALYLRRRALYLMSHLLVQSLTPPPPERVALAIKVLYDVGALTSDDEEAEVSELGRLAADMPVDLALVKVEHILFVQKSARYSLS